MRKIAIFYATYDGIINTMCGVGVISRAFISSFTEVRNFYLKKEIQLDLHLISIALTDEAIGVSEEITNESFKVAQQCGGTIHYIINGTDGTEQFGDADNWKIASTSAANKVLEIAKNYDESLVYCIDTPFMHTPYFIELQKSAFTQNRITSFLVLHSDVLSHHPENPDKIRLDWEKSAIEFALNNKNVIFAKTSDFLMSHLIKNYFIPLKKIANFQSGIDLKSPRYKNYTQKQIKDILDSYGISTDKNLIFSVGRAVPYKGFELLIEAFSKLNNKDTHLVFIASPYKTAPSNVRELKHLLSKYKINCTPIFKLDLELPNIICQWEKTKIVAQLSEHEPFGLVPEEIRLWSNKTGPVILTSNKEGYQEQITDNIDGFTVSLVNTQRIADKIDSILQLPKSEIQEIKDKGLKRLKDNYNYHVSITQSIAELLKLPAEKIITEFKER